MRRREKNTQAAWRGAAAAAAAAAGASLLWKHTLPQISFTAQDNQIFIS